MTQNADQRQELIESRIDKEIAAALPLTSLGLAFQGMGEVMEFAKMMAVSGPAVRPVFRNNPGACLAVTMKAQFFGFEPYSFASKCYFVNDELAYESQLVHSIILAKGGMTKRPTIDFEGEGDQRICIITLHLPEPDGDKVYRSPEFGKIQPKNSPLWKTDPDQQHIYYSVRAAARRFIPDVILGMYDVEEMGAAMREVNARPAPNSNLQALTDKLAGAKVTPVVIDQTAAEAPQTAENGGGHNHTAETAGPSPAPAAPAGDMFEEALVLELTNALKTCTDRASFRVVRDEFVATISMMSPGGQQSAEALLMMKRRELGIQDGEEA